MIAYPIFTVERGVPERGAVVRRFELSDGTVIPAILIGERGRGRELGVLPVAGVELSETGSTTIYAASIAETRSGRKKLIAADSPNTQDAAIVVFRTKPGYRGGCVHTGDIVAVEEDEDAFSPSRYLSFKFAPLPGEVLCEGYTAQGDAGRMGGGPQIVLLLPRGEVVRVNRSGRLYGDPPSRYFVFDGDRLLVATWDERFLHSEDHPLSVERLPKEALETILKYRDSP